jgi:pyridoxal phosphate enzyme (YggS family)
VTKQVGVREARWLLEAGLSDLGENRPEELAAKAADPSLAGARWHLIGTYQRRKVRDTLGAVAVVHSVHSAALASALSARAVELDRDVDCFVQVNVSGEQTKQGFSPDAARAALDVLRELPRLRWRGLMTMAPAGGPPGGARAVFAAARELRDRLRDDRLPLAGLSMGMSSDYADAILEGATVIRVGTVLFLASGEAGS